MSSSTRTPLSTAGPDSGPGHGRPDEKIAIVGIGCRFAPDLDTPDKYWEFLMAGRDAVGEVPGKRWEPYASSDPEVAGVLRRTTRFGAFLRDIEGFDAGHFGISPRECEYLDPQQRILLEITWEALERAGIPPHELSGTDTGVFIAANSFDYGHRMLADLPRLESWAVNGAMLFSLSNRISHAFDLAGPSLTVDAACAGSLASVHLACQSLARGEVPVAIAGGVNVMAGPALTVALDAAGATAPDGRCKAFDRAADGYGRGEGAGVVVLKRLADAVAAGDPVLAVILGTAVNQDGRTPGRWAPNADAQVRMMRRLLHRIGVRPAAVGYVEAHGTGTPNGDRAELSALADVYGAGRHPARPCLVGSVKPNVGHLEAAAGVAGLVKAAIAVRHGAVPPSLHSEPNPDFDWQSAGLRLASPTEPAVSTAPAGGPPRLAAVSSYGIGGTLAHAVLAEPPAPVNTAAHPRDEGTARLFVLSAASEGALRGLASGLAEWLAEHPLASLASVGRTLATRRSHLSRRAAVTAGDAEELAARLRALAVGDDCPEVVTGRATGPGDPVWVFSGHGAQWSGMGRQLLKDEPAFAAVMDTLAPIYRAELGISPREAIVEGDWSSPTRVQALTFAMQVGLAEVWRARGVRPGAVVGHSVGEIAASVAAGALDLEPAAVLACRRAALLRQPLERGAMALVGMPFAEAESMDPLLPGAAAASAHLAPRSPQVPLYSSTMPDPRSAVARNADYWITNMRAPCRFSHAVEAAIADGHRTFLEISSHPVVAHSVNEALSAAGVPDALVTYSLRRGCPETPMLLRALAELHCHGVPVDWSRGHPRGVLVDLPTMAWQRRSYWLPPAPRRAASGGGHDPAGGSLLGTHRTVSSQPPVRTWDTYLDFGARPYPGQHPVHGVEIVPAAVLLNTLLAASSEPSGGQAERGLAVGGPAGPEPAVRELTDVSLRIPISVDLPRAVQILRQGDHLQISSRVLEPDGDAAGGGEQPWTTHTAAVAARGAALTDRFDARYDLPAIRSRCPRRLGWAALAEHFRGIGVGGFGFGWTVDELRLGTDELIATICADPAGSRAAQWAELVDGALTCTPLLLPQEETVRMPAHIERFTTRTPLPDTVVVHAWRCGRSPRDTVHAVITNPSGQPLVTVGGLRFGKLHGAPAVAATPRHLVYELGWRSLAPAVAVAPDPAGATPAVIFVGGGARAGELSEALQEQGCRCLRVPGPAALPSPLPPGPGAVVVLPDPPDAGNATATGSATGTDAAERAERHVWTLAQAARRLAGGAPNGGDSGDGGAAGCEPAGWRLWCVTEGVRDGRGRGALAQAPLWGAARIIAGEQPQLWGGIVDLAPSAPGAGERLLELLRAAPREDVVSITPEGVVQAARLVPAERRPAREELSCRAGGTYLITGGLGGLGLQIARWLVDRGARRLVLASRKGLPPRRSWPEVTGGDTARQIAAVRCLEDLGATVRTLALDIADSELAAAALDPAALDLPPIRGVVHAAGVATHALLAEVTPDSLHASMRAKAHGALVLHGLFPPGSLDFFVLFSSAGQYARISGQTGYAAANSFLDALAAYRRRDGHHDTVSLAWTAWRGAGMSAALDAAIMEAGARGAGPVTPAEAFEAWRWAHRLDGGYFAIVRASATPPAIQPPPALAALAAGTGTAGSAAEPASRPEPTPEDVGRQVAAVLKLPLDELDARQPLTELGIDSVMTVSLRIALQRRYGVEVPPTILWNRPTIAAIADFLSAVGPPTDSP